MKPLQSRNLTRFPAPGHSICSRYLSQGQRSDEIYQDLRSDAQCSSSVVANSLFSHLLRNLTMNRRKTSRITWDQPFSGFAFIVCPPYCLEGKTLWPKPEKGTNTMWPNQSSARSRSEPAATEPILTGMVGNGSPVD